MSIQQPAIFYPGNDQIYTWGPLILGSTQYSAPPTYVNDAIGTLTLLDPTGNAVTGASAIPFVYVSSSNGLYIASIIGSGFNPSVGVGYTLVISLTSASQSATNKWSLPAQVQLRSSS